MMGPKRPAANGRTSPGGGGSGSRNGTPLRNGNSTASPQAKAPATGGARLTTPLGRVSPTARRTDSPLSVPHRGELKATPQSNSSKLSTSGTNGTTLRRTGSRGLQDVSAISNVPTRDALTGKRLPTPTRALNTTSGSSGPPTPMRVSARSGTQPTGVRARSPLTTNGPARLGDKTTGSKVVTSSRVDAELEYDRRKKRLEKISQIAKLVEKEANNEARDEARVKPGMVTSGKVGLGGPRRDAELGPNVPHRHGSPMRRLGSLGSDSTLNGSSGRREVSPTTAASKRQFPGRSTHTESDRSKQPSPVGRAKATGGTPRSTFSKDLKPWELKSDTPPCSGSPEARWGLAARRASPINRQQDTTAKKPAVSKASVPSSRKDCNPGNFARPAGSAENSATNSARTSPGRRGTGPNNHPEMFNHPLYTKPSLRPGYQGPSSGLSGSTANHDYHPPTNNILGLKHTDKPGTKFEKKEAPKVQSKRCSSADSGPRTASTGNPSEMSPSPSDRSRSAAAAPVVRGSSPGHRTSAENMLAVDNRTGTKSVEAAALGHTSPASLRLRNLSSPTTGAAASHMSPAAPVAASSPLRVATPRNGTPTNSAPLRVATPRNGTPTNSAGMTSSRAALAAPKKRSTSPSFQTSNQNPFSIASRGLSPTVVVPKYKRTVTLHRSSPHLLTEVETTGAKLAPPPQASSTRRKYANASTAGSTLNWATDSPH